MLTLAGIVIILIMALTAVASDYLPRLDELMRTNEIMGDLSALFIIKAIGSAIGSAIAVVFQPHGDQRLKLIQRFVIGTILGFISAPLIIDYFGWAHRMDYWLAASTFGGLIGYLSLQVVFSIEYKAIAKRIVGTK